MPKYAAFLQKTNRKDLKKVHIFMNDVAQARLFEFYLCCALRLRPEAVEEAGEDSERLLKLARTVAEEDVEPYFQACRDFAAGYDESLHRRIDETTIWREVEDGLFWHHSFEVAAPSQYAAFRAATLPAEADWPAREDAAGIEAALEACGHALATEGEEARAIAEDVFRAFLEASAMPVRGSIRNALIDHGIMWGKVIYRGLDDSAFGAGTRGPE